MIFCKYISIREGRDARLISPLLREMNTSLRTRYDGILPLMNACLLLGLVWGRQREEETIDLAWFNDTVGLHYWFPIHNFRM
jgi:hypothetical protein